MSTKYEAQIRGSNWQRDINHAKTTIEPVAYREASNHTL